MSDKKEVVKGRPTITSDRVDKHYYMVCTIEGEDIIFLVDTGATVTMLGYEDAERIGLRPSEMGVVGYAETAAGSIGYSETILPELIVGHIITYEKRVCISTFPTSQSIMGMDIISSFSSIEICENTMSFWL
jgi:aspartyl protease family protein